MEKEQKQELGLKAIARTRETLWYLIYPSPSCSFGDTVVCTDMAEEIMADLAWFLALFILFCSSPGILRQPQGWYLFCPCGPYGSLVSFIGEEEEEEEEERKKKEKNGFSILSKFGFYKAELKSEGRAAFQVFDTAVVLK